VCQDERFGVPTVVITFANGRSVPVRIRAVVELPPELGIDEVGFHPEYRGEEWEVDEEGRLAFETEVEPDGEVRTLYAVGSSEPDRVASLLESLSIETVTALSGTADRPGTAPAADGPADGDGASGESGGLVGNGTTEPETPEGETVDANAAGGPSEREKGVGDPDGADSSAETGASADEDGNATDGERTGGGTTGGDTASDTEAAEGDTRGTEREGREPADGDPAAGAGDGMPSDSTGPGDGTVEAKPLSEYPTAGLLEELDRRREAGGLTDHDGERLRALLPEDAGESGAEDSDGVDPRIADIQERLAALEALLGPGPGDGRPSTVESADLEVLSERVAAIGDEVATTRERVEAFGARLDALEDRVSGADGPVGDGEGATARIDALEGAVATLREEVRDGGSDGPGYDAWPG
jgi:hypothetical protein